MVIYTYKYGLFWTHFHDIQNSEQRYIHMPDIKFYSNLYIRKVWIEINLRPQVKYDFHSADFHDTKLPNTIMCRSPT